MKSIASHVALVALVAGFGSAMPALAHDDEGLAPVCPSPLPASLQPAADQRLRFARAASGVQVYICTTNAAGAYGWLFIAPQANLYNDDADLVGTHSIGPVWQGNDGSAVKAAKVAGATIDPTAVPWLLLRSVGNVGPGRFSEISSLQRLNTTGGLAPAASTCSVSNVGAVAQVPYTADYFFYDTHVSADANNQCR